MLTLLTTNHRALRVSSFQRGHPSSSLWEREGLRRIKMMPQDMQDAINHALETGDFTGEAY